MAMYDDKFGRFALLASAIAGRTLDVAPAGMGEPAWTDGSTIYVDAGADAAPGAVVNAVAVQASLLAAGSLDADILRGLPRRAAAARRYLAIEGHRALAEQEALLPPSVRRLVDHGVAARSDSPSVSLALAGSREPIDDPPTVFGSLRPRQMRTPSGLEDVTVKIRQSFPRDQMLRELDDGEEDEHEPLVFDLSSPVGGSGAIGRLLKRLLSDTSAGSAGGAPPGASEPTHVSRRSTGSGRVVAASAVRTAAPDDGGLVVSGRGHTYPEWDVFQRRYRYDWCTVIEVEPSADAAVPLAVPDAHSLRRPLARLGMELERRHRQLQGDEVDVDAAVEARVELTAGSAPDEAVYVDSVRARRDLAVLVLLDVSGSAGEPSATGVPVHEHQCAAAAALTVALHELGDRVALYAFRSHGRGAVNALPVKRFDDALDAEALRRLGGLTPGAYTRLGAAIRHGACTLEHGGGTARRLLVVLSDGFAYDHGYEGAYGEADARRALAEARRRGTGCLCLSIGAGADPQDLRRVFGTAAHASIPRADQLSGMVGPLFRSALRSAEVQRTMSQRRERARERLAIERRTG